MIQKRGGTFIQQVWRLMPWLLFLILAILPLVYLGGFVAVNIFQGPLPLWNEIVSNRTINLLFDSVLLAGLVAGFTLLISLGFGLFTFSKIARFTKELKWILLFMAAIPSYIEASVWLDILYFLKLPTQGFLICFWVQAITLLPLSVLLISYGFEKVVNAEVEMGRIYSTDFHVLRKVVWPNVRPYALASFGIIFVFSLLDFTIPTIFQVPVYSLEIFEEYAATGQYVIPFLKGIVLWLVTASLFIASSYWFIKSFADHQESDDHRKSLMNLPILPKILQYAALMIILLLIGAPLAVLIAKTNAARELWDALATHLELYGHSLGLASISALLATLLAFWLVKMSQMKKLFPWMLIILPICAPPVLSGLGLQILWNHQPLQAIYGSNVILILVNMLRILPLAILILYIFKSQIPNLLLESGKLYQKSNLSRWTEIELPLLMPGLISTFLICLILSLGEVGISISVVPPGGETLSLRIFNYLHYGASEMVSSMALIVFLIFLICYLIHLGYRMIKAKSVRI